MVPGGLRLSGLFAVLLALMAQLGAGASVPRLDPAVLAGVLCHVEDNGQQPGHAPNHPSGCPLCPICASVQAQPIVLASAAPDLRLPAAPIIVRPEMPPPSTAPPAPHRPPSQPRAPPILS